MKNKKKVFKEKDPRDQTWFILHRNPSNSSFQVLDWVIFQNPVHHGLVASYAANILKGYKGEGEFAICEIKSLINVVDNTR